MPKKQTKTLLISLIITDIIFVGFSMFLYNFTKTMIADSVTNEDQIKTELKKENVAVLMKDDLAKGKIYQEQLTNYLIKSGGTVEFIEILEKLVADSGLKSEIKNVSTEPYKKTNTTFELLRINVDVIGEWKNINFFLTALENYPLQIDINKVSLNKYSDYNVKGKLVPQWSGSFDFTVVKIKDAK